LSLLASAFCLVILTFMAMYVACTSPHGTIIGGVQGRYFVPAVFALGASISGLGTHMARSPSARLHLSLLVIWVGASSMTMTVDAWRLYGHL
jgi:hypothetical protein